MSPLPGKPCEHFVDTQWKDCGGESTKFKNSLDRVTQISCDCETGAQSPCEDICRSFSSDSNGFASLYWNAHHLGAELPAPVL